MTLAADDDARDLAIHDGIETRIQQIMRTNNLSRYEVLVRLIAFIENDDEGELLVEALVLSRIQQLKPLGQVA